jgi:hypothetical protein
MVDSKIIEPYYQDKKIAQERKAALKEKKNVEVTEEDTSEEVITTEE